MDYQGSNDTIDALHLQSWSRRLTKVANPAVVQTHDGVEIFGDPYTSQIFLSAACLAQVVVTSKAAYLNPIRTILHFLAVETLQTGHSFDPYHGPL